MIKTRALLLVLALALLGLFVAWFAAERVGEAHAPNAPSHDTTRPIEAATETAVETPAVAIERAEVSAEALDPSPATVADSAPEESHSSALELRGRLVVLDPNGVELAPPDARFQLTGWRGSRGDQLDVEVRAGVWEARFEDANGIDAIAVSAIRCGELSPTLESPRDRVPLPASGELEIRARLPRSASLRVIDAASGADLADVTIVRPASFPMDDAAHPGARFDERIVARGMRSPVALDGLRAELSQGALVGADGYAWALVKPDFERGGERVVALARGAELEVQVRGVDPTAHARLRLRTELHPQPVCEQILISDATFVLRGLEPATYAVQAEIGEWFREPARIGVETVTLAEGERARIELVLVAAPRIERASAGGVVYVPVEWKRERVQLVMKLLDTPLDGQETHLRVPGQRVSSERSGFEAFTWSHKAVQAGRYEFGVYAPAFSVVLDVPPGGRTDFELVVPPPIELRVYLVDDATGDPLTVDGLLWNPRRPEGVTGGGLEHAARDAENERYVIRAPASPIELHVWSWDFQPFTGAMDPTMGETELTVRLKRSCGIVLRLEDQGTAIALPEGWVGAPSAINGPGNVQLSQSTPLSPRWMLSEPGLYQLELPKLPGYRQPPVQTIEVLAGQFTEHVVQLEREHP